MTTPFLFILAKRKIPGKKFARKLLIIKLIEQFFCI